jgi:hypothetical protein
MPGGEGRVEPLGKEDRPRRGALDALADALDLRPHPGDDAATAARDVQELGERDDSLFDLGDRVSIECNHLRAGGTKLLDAVGGHRANGAEVLGEDDVGIDRLEDISVDRVERTPVADGVANRSVDLTTGEPRRVDARGGYDRQPADLGRPVALFGDRDERVGETERADDLRRAGKKRADSQRP